jgi:hypothetical protein
MLIAVVTIQPSSALSLIGEVDEHEFRSQN